MNYITNTRTIVSWSVLILTILFLLLIRPEVKVNQRVMYLPKIENLSAINKDNVKVIKNDGFTSIFGYREIGAMTVIMPFQQDNITNVRYDALNTMLDVTARAGADRLLIASEGVRPWFDTGQSVFRVQAIALQQ